MKVELPVISVLFFILLQVGCTRTSNEHNAKVTIKVIDESAQVIKDASVGIGFSHNSDRNKETSIIGTTNEEGLFSGTGRTNGLVGATVTKDGYYKSIVDSPFNDKSDGRWLPWNPELVVVLRKIVNPVPMYARVAEIHIPDLNKEIGFDLIECDWMAPYGKGKHTDLIFKVKRNYVNQIKFDGVLTISTPYKYDGIQLVKENLLYGSEFKLPRIAPSADYEKSVIKTITAIPGKSIQSDSEEGNNYIFRIRSEQKTGMFYRAMYGKILRDFRFWVGAESNARIAFQYYLNPDYTQNLEFNPKQNLFTNLKSVEQVSH